ncbi:hypothetical protein FJU08_22315 [Martelella alba]|uniref:Uncharacterized protein n=1 Tax=Martelella alba TaxID=2590451 RepID=A0A506U1C8_9HYPH|nr:hypothetical protein [Martelella alba]TPW26419.1 hypothetical protein FJU08_22315 [Martelella alba]
MTLVTRSELTGLRIDELRGLLHQIFNTLANTAPASLQHREALASLENIQAELRSRDPSP